MSSEQEEKGSTTQAERLNSNDQSQLQSPRRKRGCVGFLKKWWWLLLIIFIIVVLVVVLPVIFVAVPKIIRDQINNAKLTVQGISVTSTRTGTYELGINSTVTTSSSQSAKIDSFNASMYLEDKLPHTPFVFLQMPEIHSKKVVPVNISQAITISDEQAFADFNSWYLFNDTFLVTVDGWTHVHVGSLPSTKVHFQKTVNLTGLNSFSGINITSSRINLTADSLGNNFFGFVTIPNPSVLTVDFGNVSFASSLNGSNIGQSFIDNLLLVPGSNNVSIRANISQAPVLEAVEAQPACNTGFLPFSFIGENITNSGSELPYFEQAFRVNNLSLDVDVGADIEAVLPINITCS